jgi:EmrB/QacA subfamily drug resistance transporter
VKGSGYWALGAGAGQKDARSALLATVSSLLATALFATDFLHFGYPDRMTEPRSSRMLLWLVAIGFFMQTLDTTIVNTALPSIARSLGESPLRMQAVVIAYSLTMAILLPASGWIADRFGVKRAYCGAIVVFVIGSLACALSSTMTQLVISRIVQGAGGALLLPVGRLAVLLAYPREQFLKAMSFVAVPGLIGPLIGPTLGGWLSEAASWHWIFLINIPIGAIGAAATLRFMSDQVRVARSGFDFTGYFLIAFGMVAISVALEGLGELGLRGAIVIILLVFGLASICAYWLHAARTERPLFSPALFHTRTYSIGLLGNLFARLGIASVPFLVPLVLQVSLGFSPLESGVSMIPVALAALLAKRLVTGLITRFGYRKVLMTNTLLVGVMIASFGLVGPGHPAWLRVLQLFCLGAVNSVQFTAMNTVTLKDLTSNEASSGNSLLSVVQMLSMSLGVAAAAALLATFTEVFADETHAHALSAFQATFLCMGILTCASAWIFWQLESDVREAKTEEEPVELG